MRWFVMIVYPAVLTGVAALTIVTTLQVEMKSTTHWLPTTDLDLARQHLAYIGGVEIGVLALADVVEKQYGGLAVLTTISSVPVRRNNPFMANPPEQ